MFSEKFIFTFYHLSSLVCLIRHLIKRSSVYFFFINQVSKKSKWILKINNSHNALKVIAKYFWVLNITHFLCHKIFLKVKLGYIK